MPATTTYTDTTMSVRDIGGRTDFAGGAVTDLNAEEDRFPSVPFSQGVLGTNTWKVAAGSGMDVVVGSGPAKADYANLIGTVSGQGAYFVRLDEATKTLTLDAADPAQPRIDEVYLVVRDDAYDSTGRALPSLAVRKGVAAASPAAPGADAAWKAYLLLSSIAIPASAPNIGSCTLTDSRTYIALNLGTSVLGWNAAHSALQLMAETGDVVQLLINGTTELELSATQLDLKNNNLVNATIVGGNFATHTHDGVTTAVLSHAGLSDLAVGDPHTQYLLDSGFTKVAIDAMGIAAATAAAWATSRSLTLSGDVSGSASGIDGTGNIAIVTTVADDSHAHVVGNVDGLQDALDLKLALAGGTMAGAIAMGTNKITGLGDAAAGKDALNRDSGDARFLKLTGGTMAGAIAMGAQKITGLGTPTLADDAAPKTYVDTAVAAITSIPIGTILAWAGAAAPAGGFNLCDGTALSRVTYATLFALIGTTYGIGDGVNTFNVPDLRQRFPLGKAASGTGSTLGGTGGTIDHVHSGPSHSHSIADYTASGTTSSPTGTTTVPNAPDEVGVATSAHTHTFTGYVSSSTNGEGTGNTGAGNPPFLAVNYIIKTT